MSMVVVGSIAIDSVTTPYGKVEENLGGSGMFFSASASFLAPPTIVAVVGRDFDLDKLDFLTARGVDLSKLEIAEGKTFRWKGEYGSDMNDAKTLATELNVFEHFQPVLQPSERAADVVFLANIMPKLQLQVLDQIDQPKFVAADTMNLWIDSAKDDLMKVLERVNMVVINEGEAKMLAQEKNTVKAAQIVREMGPEVVVVKRGEYGVLMLTEGGFFAAPAFPLASVFDPTGAGDTFAGGLMSVIAQHNRFDDETLRKGVIMGTVLASFCVEEFGPKRMMHLKAEEISARYEEISQLMTFPVEPPQF